MTVAGSNVRRTVQAGTFLVVLGAMTLSAGAVTAACLVCLNPLRSPTTYTTPQQIARCTAGGVLCTACTAADVATYCAIPLGGPSWWEYLNPFTWFSAVEPDGGGDGGDAIVPVND